MALYCMYQVSGIRSIRCQVDQANWVNQATGSRKLEHKKRLAVATITTKEWIYTAPDIRLIRSSGNIIFSGFQNVFNVGCLQIVRRPVDVTANV